MFGLYSRLRGITRHGPIQLVRDRIKMPLIKFVHDTVDLYQTRTKEGVNSIKEVLFRGAIIALITALLVWISIFMYIVFYYAYVPTISHEHPVHLKFKTCEYLKKGSDASGVCSYPTAHIKLTERQRLLMVGQPYRIHLELEMPESQANRDAGMFMVCADFHDSGGYGLYYSCRSAMFPYRSFYLEVVQKVLLSPLYVFGNFNEKQHVQIELFSEFEEKSSDGITNVVIEIQSKSVQIYSARFLINANFTGLRYLMYNWPIFSAAIGITSNLMFIAIVSLVSWYQIINSDEYQSYIQSHNTSEEECDDSSSSSVNTINEEDVSLLGDTEPMESVRFRKSTPKNIQLIESIDDAINF